MIRCFRNFQIFSQNKAKILLIANAFFPFSKFERKYVQHCEERLLFPKLMQVVFSICTNAMQHNPTLLSVWEDSPHFFDFLTEKVIFSTIKV